MTELRQGLPELPERIQKLPIDERGYPIPWFVQWFTPGGIPCKDEPRLEIDHPDFRVVDSRKRIGAIKHRLCWVCGEPVGSFLAFVIGP